MGDRCVILIEDENGINNAACYLHWNGHNAIDLITNALTRMRYNDSVYSLGRLIGYIHTQIDTNLSLGCFGIDISDSIETISNGDAGVIVYNCMTGNIRTSTDGYLKDKNNINIGIPPK